MWLLTAAGIIFVVFLIRYVVRVSVDRRESCCYMLNYECYKPTDGSERKLSTESSCRIVTRNPSLGLEEYRFLLQTMVKAGIGEETYCPKNVIAGNERDPTLVDALEEMDDIFFQTIDRVIQKAGIVSPADEIDILVVNVSLLSPAPSLTARVINRYKLRDDLKVYNLSGMGCSASAVAVDLVSQLFKVHRRQVALVVSTESLGPNWYCGREKSFMLSNCLFRSGGCSMLLTNDPTRRNKAIMKLTHSIRTDIGSNDDAYECCIQVEDKEGYRGFRLTKKLTKAAAQAFVINLQVLAPLILPLWELLRWIVVAYLPWWWRKTMTRRSSSSSTAPEPLGSVPSLKTGIEHFCIHPGGRAVIDGVGRSLGLTEYDLEPARMTLHRWGNTSAGGLWYVLGYMEAKKRLKKGDRILMISLGAGFMCNNCTWEVLGDNMNDPNVWADCLDKYPLSKAGLVNPFADRFDWLNDECLGFVRLEHSAFHFSSAGSA